MTKPGMNRRKEEKRKMKAETEGTVRYEVTNGIACITMNKPENGNCINRMMTEPLFQAFSRAEADEEVKVVILRGNGRTFCTGGDVRRMSGLEGTRNRHDEVRASGQAVRKIMTMEKPVICGVQGFVAGAGLGLMLACDLVVCQTSTRFMTAFSNVGLASDCGAAYMLAKILGKQKAKELLFFSDIMTAQEMYELGLVNKIVADASLEEEVEAMAARLLDRPRFATALIKNLVNRSDEMSLESSLLYEESLQAMLMDSEDFREGTGAFLEKRKPGVGGQGATSDEKAGNGETE